jgi:hypothetical protein
MLLREFQMNVKQQLYNVVPKFKCCQILKCLVLFKLLFILNDAVNI